MEKPAQITVRTTPALAERLRAAHRTTYPEHGTSFNTWLVGLIAEALARREGRLPDGQAQDRRSKR